MRKPNLAKSIQLRNISIKPWWKKWKNQANLLNNKDN